uniref:G-protein coupled receptors family 1 profile domain-containing protein n=1 Tax=Oncorhynchus mykiss TaxID=8022 RepID=A0A8C7Q262_ONCMY
FNERVVIIQVVIVQVLNAILANILLLLSFFAVPMPVAVCIIIRVFMSVLTFATPLTLTAMSLERYVAICMPLRHGELSTVRRAIHCILLIHSISAIQSIIMVSIFLASVPLDFYTLDKQCSVEMLVVHRWQGHIRSAVSQFYFLVMSITIVFTYARIIAVAKEASSDSMKSSSKSHKMGILHSIQLFLCLIQIIFISVRYFDYIVFILDPQCLSPLVYGLMSRLPPKSVPLLFRAALGVAGLLAIIG